MGAWSVLAVTKRASSSGAPVGTGGSVAATEHPATVPAAALSRPRPPSSQPAVSSRPGGAAKPAARRSGSGSPRPSPSCRRGGRSAAAGRGRGSPGGSRRSRRPAPPPGRRGGGSAAAPWRRGNRLPPPAGSDRGRRRHRGRPSPAPARGEQPGRGPFSAPAGWDGEWGGAGVRERPPVPPVFTSKIFQLLAFACFLPG